MGVQEFKKKKKKRQKELGDQEGKRDGMGKGDLRGSSGCGITDDVRVGRTLVLESQALQGVRREEGPCTDHFQRRLCLLLQPFPACSL